MEISLKELLEAGCHFGHQTVRWNPKMKQYIFAAREGVHIFDLVKTKSSLEEAAAFAKETVANGGKILFVGTKRQARSIVEEAAKSVGMPYVSHRWLGGMLTNWDQIKKSINKLAEEKSGLLNGGYKELTKKEQLLISRDVDKLEKFIGGISTIKDLPQAVFIIDTKRESAAVNEACRKELKIIAMVDTNSNPDSVDYVIPVNDDAAASIKLIVDKMAEAIGEGLKEAKDRTDKEAKVAEKEAEKEAKKTAKTEEK